MGNWIHDLHSSVLPLPFEWVVWQGALQLRQEKKELHLSSWEGIKERLYQRLCLWYSSHLIKQELTILSTWTLNYGQRQYCVYLLRCSHHFLMSERWHYLQNTGSIDNIIGCRQANSDKRHHQSSGNGLYLKRKSVQSALLSRCCQGRRMFWCSIVQELFRTVMRGKLASVGPWYST